MRISYNYIIVSFLFFTSACTKEGLHRPYSYISARFLGDEEDIQMETLVGEWDFITHTATLNAKGYKFATFGLYLSLVNNLGSYTSIAIGNISLSDGLDFVPIRLTGVQLPLHILIQFLFVESLQFSLKTSSMVPNTEQLPEVLE
jgi:hypothetical protein